MRVDVNNLRAGFHLLPWVDTSNLVELIEPF